MPRVGTKEPGGGGTAGGRMSDEQVIGNVVDAALSRAGMDARREWLVSSGAALSPALSAAFAARAHAAMRSDPAEAEKRAGLALFVAESCADGKGIVEARGARAQAAILLGRHQDALADLDAARAAVPASETAPAEIDVLAVEALLYTERWEQAETLGGRVLERCRADGDAKGEAWIRMTLADLAFRLDRPREALAHYHAVEGLVPAAKPSLRAAVASNRANSLAAVNRFRAAARQFEEAKRLFTETGAEHTAAQVEYNAAYADSLRGRYADALQRYARAEEAFTRFTDARHLAHTDLDRAEIHLHLSLPEDARRYAERAEARFTELALGKEAAQAALFAGRAAEMQGRNSDADAAYGRAEEGFARLGLSERRAQCLLQRASLAKESGEREKAAVLLDGAEAALPDDANVLTRSSLDLLRARLALLASRPEDARALAERVLVRGRRVHAPWMRMDAHWVAGKACALLEKIPEALVHYESAIADLEAYRGGVPPDEYMTAFLAGRSSLYREIVELLVRTGEVELAFSFAEKAKARALVDLLAGRQSEGGAASAEEPAGRRVRALRERLSAIYRRLAGSEGRGTRTSRFQRDARRAARRLEGVIGRILREKALKEPRLAALEPTSVPGLAEVQADLADDTALVEYFLTGESVVTFVVTRDAVRVARTKATEEQIRFLLQRFHYHLSRYDRDEVPAEDLLLQATRANLGRLADLLLTPIEGLLDRSRLVLVPHGVLHLVPFHALPLGTGWVADRYDLVYAPSAAVYARCGVGREPARGPAAVFGIPDEVAPQIGREAKDVGATLPGSLVFLGERATFDRLKEAGATARVIHIATHGMFCAERPMLSSIRLADRWMNLYDLYDMDVRSALVVLSTCESGTAGVSKGDEIQGLTRGFLFAGASALLTSQWRVHDEATREFMEAFYERWQACGDPVRAVRRAMTAVRAKRPHPYYWAPFFLTGRPLAETSPEALLSPVRAPAAFSAAEASLERN